MANVYYEDDNCKIYLGDCLEVLPELSPVDLVVTDPPYSFKVAGARSFEFLKGEGYENRNLLYSKSTRRSSKKIAGFKTNNEDGHQRDCNLSSPLRC